ncbi:hypothetical protein M8542_42925 [Amycolatopsis sp. OK19-0408]|uniref:Uncharacterized protein n=1 Tax=Amycolatopsis iheyensis TaxID=2945988 RepID=A0A9X2NMI7_9PSEU|nr:hypothetical protein [Amycolatopsis iheyensis]MCR6489590.1 hypothetical protein [Amycolatopsis iheyensis]
MNTLAIRLTLVLPFLEQLVVGAWNAFAPESFYEHFPTVDLNPPFSEHYAHDFGGATLGIALLLAIALVKPKTHFVVPAALAFSVWQVPHFCYHLLHTEPPTTGMTVFLHTANGVVALLGLAPVLLALRRDRRHTTDHPIGA